MSILRTVGGWIQRALFTTTFTDIVDSIDALRIKVEELDKKLEREAAQLKTQIDDAKRAKTGGK